MITIRVAEGQKWRRHLQVMFPEPRVITMTLGPTAVQAAVAVVSDFLAFLQGNSKMINKSMGYAMSERER